MSDVEWIPSTLVPEDDKMHRPTSDEAWRESGYLTFYDPAKDLSGFIWTGVRPPRDESELRVCIWRGDELVYQNMAWGVPDVSHEARQDHFDVGPLRFECDEPFRRWSLYYSDDSCTVDVVWEAINPVFDYRWEEDLPIDSKHLEQVGSVEGTIELPDELGDRTVPLSGYGARDRSWGVRDHSDYEYWICFTPVFSDDLAINVAPIRVDGQKYLYGFLWKDGTQGRIHRLELSADFEFVGGPAAESQLLIVDKRGRELVVEAETCGVYPGAFGEGVLYIGQAKFYADGHRGYGVCDYCWNDLEEYDTGIKIHES